MLIIRNVTSKDKPPTSNWNLNTRYYCRTRIVSPADRPATQMSDRAISNRIVLLRKDVIRFLMYHVTPSSLSRSISENSPKFYRNEGPGQLPESNFLFQRLPDKQIPQGAAIQSIQLLSLVSYCVMFNHLVTIISYYILCVYPISTGFDVVVIAIRVTRPSALGMALLVRTVCRNRLHVGRKRRLRWKISSRNNACGSRSNKIVRVPDAQRSFSTSKQFKHFWQQIRRVDICQPVRP
ncbi:unnamed protein product [Nesidiocoris tenuis]|uniref:Uncharacterized protein n=1 Tax=Nesidiocoris tenuis TaxID=355587 RepID=A0A6H5G1Z5_9HEMI|nr:unnamed protein product [Nesidiocoris tenuis]